MTGLVPKNGLRGVCLTCVIPVKNGEGWEYQRTCMEGPVFDAKEIVWEATA